MNDDYDVKVVVQYYDVISLTVIKAAVGGAIVASINC